MALGDGSAWNPNVPGNSAVLKDGAAEIRDLRQGVETRIEREHSTYAASGLGGEHLAGSALAYSQSAAPTDRPDAATATTLTAADSGRLWVDTDNGILLYYAHANWIPVAGSLILSGSLVFTNNYPAFVSTVYGFSLITLFFTAGSAISRSTSIAFTRDSDTVDLRFIMDPAGSAINYDIDVNQSLGGTNEFRIKRNVTSGSHTVLYRVFA